MLQMRSHNTHAVNIATVKAAMEQAAKDGAEMVRDIEYDCN